MKRTERANALCDNKINVYILRNIPGILEYKNIRYIPVAISFLLVLMAKGKTVLNFLKMYYLIMKNVELFVTTNSQIQIYCSQIFSVHSDNTMKTFFLLSSKINCSLSIVVLG